MKKLLFLLFLAALAAAFWFILRPAKGPVELKDLTQLSRNNEKDISRFLQSRKLKPFALQERTQERDGARSILYYRKYRVDKKTDLAALESSLKTFAGASASRMLTTKLAPSAKPSGLVLDVLLGADGLITHHLIFCQYELAQAAIIIDDIGYDGGRLTGRLLALKQTLNLSVIPGTPHGRKAAEDAFRREFPVLLHLPMEPSNYPKENPGPWGVYTGQSDAVIKEKVEKAVAWVPHAEGMNNHMGSRATTDARVMADVMAIAGKTGFYFVDSKTSPRSSAVITAAAKKAKVASAGRDVFLDNVATEAAVTERLKELARMAKRRGYAVAIGHPREATVAALEKMLPELEAQGIEFVPVRELVK
jgi:polysaccharide deacetylase 2 family uncharacterized protein YibQ